MEDKYLEKGKFVKLNATQGLVFTRGEETNLFSHKEKLAVSSFSHRGHYLSRKRGFVVFFKRVIDQTGIGGQRRRISLTVRAGPSRSISISRRVHSRENDSFNVYVISQPTIFQRL